MSEYIHKSHNVTVLMYHIVLQAKYRRAVFDESVDDVLRTVCLDVELRYQLKFPETGTDKDHVHFLVQSVPTYSVTKIVTLIKSLTAREIFRRCPQVKKSLWGGEFWTDGYFASTVGKHGDEQMMSYGHLWCMGIRGGWRILLIDFVQDFNNREMIRHDQVYPALLQSLAGCESSGEFGKITF